MLEVPRSREAVGRAPARLPGLDPGGGRRRPGGRRPASPTRARWSWRPGTRATSRCHPRPNCPTRRSSRSGAGSRWAPLALRPGPLGRVQGRRRPEALVLPAGPRPRRAEVEHSDRVASPVNAFILAQLEAKKLEPSPLADKRTLIRRATFDLIGLPPTPAEVDAFLADESAGAFAKVVDRLLASPRYGERWGRHWLDVARYADTKGYVFTAEKRYPYSYTYRDYVIRSFNEDKPYDRFLVEQIAADRLPLGDDKRPLAALGFLTVGRRFLNDNNEIIDDRIDVVTRGLMGLTVTCARCHDHKFDPIPTEDYYSLHGVFASSVEPAELPLLPDAVPEADKADYDKERQARLDKVAREKAELQGEDRGRAPRPPRRLDRSRRRAQLRAPKPQARRDRPRPQGLARAAPVRRPTAQQALPSGRKP